MNSLLLSNRIKQVKSSQTLRLAEQAKTLKNLVYKLRNLSIGEHDFYPHNIEYIYHSCNTVYGELICNKFNSKNESHKISKVLLALLNTLHKPYWVISYEMVKVWNYKPIISSYNIETIAFLTTKISTSLEELEVIVNILKTKEHLISAQNTLTLSILSQNVWRICDMVAYEWLASCYGNITGQTHKNTRNSFGITTVNFLLNYIYYTAYFAKAHTNILEEFINITTISEEI
ncbi:hypothetical protein ACWNY4_00635 [Candidatus Karelsulcia muelleri]